MKHALCSMLALAVALPVAAAQKPSPMAVAEALVDAFNRKDADGMAELVSDDFELYYVGSDGKAQLGTQGPEQLRQEMAGYFEAYPNVRSEITHRVPGPSFVSFREQIVGGDSSLTVYEVRDAKIVRVWYYPAEKDPTGSH